MILCPNCNSSNVIRAGYRINNKTKVQRYNCKFCFKRFSEPSIYRRHRFNPIIINFCLNGFKNGSSTRQLSRACKTFGFNISHETIHRWILKFLKKEPLNHIQKYLLNLAKLEEYNNKVLSTKEIKNILNISTKTHLRKNKIYKNLIKIRRGYYKIKI